MKRRAPSVLLMFLTALLCLPIAGQAQWLYGPPRRVPVQKPPDRIMVRFRPRRAPTGVRQMQALAAGRALPAMSLGREIPGLGIFVYRLSDPRMMTAAVNRLRRMPDVLYAEPAHRILLLVNDPNDYYYNLLDTETPNHVLFPGEHNYWQYQWPLHFIQAREAWTKWPNVYYTAATKPANAVKVAVVDTGVDTTHPDFINAGGTSTDSAHGGQLDLADSHNMLQGGNNPTPTDPTDEFGHGTHVTGIIAAATNNGQGVAAIGYPARVMVLKVTDFSGDGDDADVVDAIRWAADHGAVVVNLSIAVNGGYSQALQDAVNYCWLKNVLVVAASGNDGVDYVRRYPAACDKVLAVAATTYADPDPNMGTIPGYETSASYSNSGMYVGISAPGGDASYWLGGILGFNSELYTQVWSTTPNNLDTALTGGDPPIVEMTYGYLQGTSMASPHVAGLAALYAGYKGYSQSTAGAPRLIARAIQRGADNLAGRSDGGWTPALGHGRINAYATMQEIYGADRDATTPGCITGQVTFYGTPVLNAQVTAVKSGTTRQYGASSKEDGTFRIANVPAGSYTVTAYYTGLTKSATVTVEAACDTMATDFEMDASNVDITVTPHLVSLPLGGTQQFTSTVTGAPNNIVVWSVIDGPGTVSSDGLYTAPATKPSAYTAHVQAMSLADPSKTDVAEVSLYASTLLTGKVSLPGWTPPAGTVNRVRVFLFPSGSTPAHESDAVATADVSLDASGNFTIDTSMFLAGAYRLGVRPLNAPALARIAPGNVTLSTTSPPTLATLSCNLGDVNADGYIDDTDLGVVIFNQGKLGVAGDVNGDGVVDDIDLGLVIFYQGRASDFLP